MKLWKRRSNATPKYKKFKSAFQSESAWTRKIPIYGLQSKKLQMRAFLRAIQRYNKYECMGSSQGIKMDKQCKSDLKKMETLSQKSDLLKRFFEEDQYKTKYYLKPKKIDEFIDYLTYLKLNNDKNFDTLIYSLIKPKKISSAEEKLNTVAEDLEAERMLYDDNFVAQHYPVLANKVSSPNSELIPKLPPPALQSKSRNQSPQTRKNRYYNWDDGRKKGLFSKDYLSRYYRLSILPDDNFSFNNNHNYNYTKKNHSKKKSK
jgi:hypothetical protein